MKVLVLQQDGYDWTRVWAHMVHPNDDQKREVFTKLAHFENQVYSLNDDAVLTLPIPFLKELITAPSHKERLAEGVASMYRGTLAGSILHIMKSLADTGQEASKEKAIHISKQYYTNATQAGKKTAIKERESYTKYFAEFQPVLHYWAAHVLLKSNPVFKKKFKTQVVSEINTPPLPTNDEQLISFLLIAEAYQKFGLSHKQRRAKTTPLNPYNVWRVYFFQLTILQSYSYLSKIPSLLPKA